MSICDLKSYEIVQSRDLSDLSSKGTLLRHKKSGARVLLMENDDENKVFAIGFRTPPSDSTGAVSYTHLSDKRTALLQNLFDKRSR